MRRLRIGAVAIVDPNNHSSVSYMVLDEADRMLEKGFANDIQKLIGMTRPVENRQTLMCRWLSFY